MTLTGNVKMYVPGKLFNVQKIVLDIGTGFYVEKVCAQRGVAVCDMMSCTGNDDVIKDGPAAMSERLAKCVWAEKRAGLVAAVGEGL